MTDDQKAVALVKEVQAERAHTGNPWNSPTILSEALYRAVGLRAPVCGNERIEQLEREKAVVSDLWEQQKQIALDYLTDCNKAAEHIEAQAAEIERLRVEAKAQFDRGYYDGCTRAALDARGLEIRSKNE